MSLGKSLEFLGVTQDTDSDSIEAVAHYMASEGSDKAKLADALRMIAKHRGGDSILEQTATQFESYKKDDDDTPAVQGHSQGLSMFLAQLAGAHETSNQVSSSAPDHTSFLLQIQVHRIRSSVLRTLLSVRL